VADLYTPSSLGPSVSPGCLSLSTRIDSYNQYIQNNVLFAHVMSSVTPSPSKPVPSTPRRDSIHHAIVHAKTNNSPPSIRRQKQRNRILREIPTSQLTWDNYILSQKQYDKRRKTNPLRLISTLRHILFSRKYITR
jgi:hypothetical protein